MWREKFDSQMPLLGHRNWILVVDKAYPMQSAGGILTINTGESLLPVLEYVLESIKKEKHTVPVVYTDKELDAMEDDLCTGIDDFKIKLKAVLKHTNVKSILHDEIFNKLDNAAELFKIIVLKTECLMPYTSVFMELDCGYWTPEKEGALRKKIK